jgi:hypothetical protein
VEALAVEALPELRAESPVIDKAQSAELKSLRAENAALKQRTLRKKTFGFSRRPLAQGCANRNQSSKALIWKKNENDAFRFLCALKNPGGFLEAPQSDAKLRARLDALEAALRL